VIAGGLELEGLRSAASPSLARRAPRSPTWPVIGRPARAQLPSVPSAVSPWSFDPAMAAPIRVRIGNPAECVRPNVVLRHNALPSSQICCRTVACGVWTDTQPQRWNVDLPRASRANSSRAHSPFVKLHANALSMARPDVRQIETFYFQSSSPRLWPASVRERFGGRVTGQPNRGVKPVAFCRDRPNRDAAALVETGFLTGNLDLPGMAHGLAPSQLAQQRSPR